MERLILNKLLELLKSVTMRNLGVQYPDLFDLRNELWFNDADNGKLYKITVEEIKH